uniref:Rho-GAP domain-containing protein n=1 Tax=Caenorhabditis tropicalis TaxID=1561998 RepID=A0A1I7UA27_9PELO
MKGNCVIMPTPKPSSGLFSIISTQNLRLKHQLSQEFEYLLFEIPHILPGSSFESSSIYFQNFGIIKKLAPDTVEEVYCRFQEKLMEDAKKQMDECLLEAATVFQKTKETFGMRELDTVREYLEVDERFQWMRQMEEERNQIILSHLPFIFNASPLNCPESEMCIDILGTSILNDFSEQTSTIGGSSGFCECFEATRRNSGRKMARVQICAMCGDRLSIDSLAASLFHNNLIRSSTLNYSTDGASFIELLDESTQSWSTLEISMNSFHSWFHSDETNPQNSIDFTDGFLFVYNSKRASTFHYARSAIEQLEVTNLVNFDCILLVAVVEGGGGDSMKLDLEYLTEGAELCKSIGARFAVIDSRKRKSNVLNAKLMDFLHDVCDGQVQPSVVNEDIRILENDRPSILSPSFPTSGIQLLTKPDTTNRSRRQKPVNSNIRNRVTRTDPLIMSHFYSTPIEIQPAPLATPEAVDFSPAYSMVNDAVHTIIQVTASSPKTTFNSYENSSPETRSTTSTFSGSSPAPRAVSAEVTRRSRTSCVSLSTDSINRLHRTSNLFQLHPETALTAEQKQKSLSIESMTKEVEKEKCRGGFVRKVATSFRLRKSLLDTTSTDEKKEEETKKKTSATSPEQISSFLEKMATRSLPQSPRTDRKAKLYSSLNSTTEKVSNVLSWLPSKSSKRLMKNKSATHDLSTSLINYPTSTTSTQGVIASNENLESLCASSSSGIPVYLEMCIEFIENNGGFEQEGLYRVPGNQTHLAEVEKRFLKSGIFDVSSFDTPVHVAATALKSFFSCLPEPLISTNYHSRWKQIMMSSDDHEKIEGIRDALHQLPSPNQRVLRYLVKHLAKVSLSPKTVMNSNNLSKVWTPTLFRPVFTSYEELSSGIIAFQLALELLIIHSNSLFS